MKGPRTPRRFRPSRRLPFVVFSGLALLIAARVWQERARPPVPEALRGGDYRIGRVVDGDTLLLANRGRVRLIGIDAPEIAHDNQPEQAWGPEATQFTTKFIRGPTVRLTFDRERLDQYGRFLAYAWADDRLLNEELIRAGLARARLGFHYSESMKRRFRKAEEEARRARRGIWSGGDGKNSKSNPGAPGLNKTGKTEEILISELGCAGWLAEADWAAKIAVLNS